MRSLAAAVLLAVTATVALAGCSRPVPLEMAADGANVACAEMHVRLPASVQGVPQRETDAQGTSAWGDPSAIILRCGVDIPPPSTLPCVSVDGIDWIRDDSDAPTYAFTTYGRDPATQVIVDSDWQGEDGARVAAGAALFELSSAVSLTEKIGACTTYEDYLGDEPTPAP